MSGRSYLSIGDVLSLLREEFPDVTISKIRFLESQGLVDPERSPSGYRKFYDQDVERLRWVLRQQREHFLPLKVIRDRLAAAGKGVPSDEGYEANGSGPGGTDPDPDPDADDPDADDPDADDAAADDAAADDAAADDGWPVDPEAERAAGGPPRLQQAGAEAGTEAAVGSAAGPDAAPHPPHTAGANGNDRPPVDLASIVRLHAGREDREGATASQVRGTPGWGQPFDIEEQEPARGTAAIRAEAPTTSSVPPAAVPSVPEREPSGPTDVSRPTDRGPSTDVGDPTDLSDSSGPTAPPVAGAPDRSSAARPPVGADAPPSVPPPSVPPPVASPADVLAPSLSGVSLTLEELCAATGLGASEIASLESYGLIAAMAVAGGTYYDEESLTVARLVVDFGRFGIEPRHLRLYRNAADREVGLVEQVITPLLRQRNPEARQRAVDAAAELVRLGQGLRASLVRSELRRQLGS